MSVEPKPIVHDRAVARLFGVMLMVVGGLIMALCGLCSLGAVGMTVVEGLRSPTASSDMVMMVPMVGIFGGVPIAVGFGVFSLGRWLHRGPRTAP